MATSDEGVRYRNKVTIVTGGARGIGRACVELFGKLNRNKSRLLFSSAKMFKKPLWQTVWTQIRLLL